MGHNSITDNLPAPKLPNLLGGGRGNGLDTTRTLLTLVEQGATPGQAFGSLVNGVGSNPGQPGSPIPGSASHSANSPNAPSAPADANTVVETLNDLPRDLQSAVLQDADAIPPPIRNILDQLGITQPQGRYEGPSQTSENGSPRAFDVAGSAREAATLARGEVATLSNAASQSLAAPNAQNAGAVAQTANAFAARDGGNAFAAGTTANGMARDQAIQQPGGRIADGQVSARASDMGNVVVMADRSNAAQQQLQSQMLPGFAAQARADALPAQAAMAALAGATVLANPLGNPVAVQPPMNSQPGTATALDGAAMQARDAHLAPAGHTVAGFLRRDARKGGHAQPERKGESLLAALLPSRKRRTDLEEDAAASSQWLYWILTIAAYASIAVAVVAMIPTGGNVIDERGVPTTGGFALLIGLVAAGVAWVVSRRLGK